LAIHQLATMRRLQAALLAAILNLPLTLEATPAPIRAVPPYVQVEPIADSTWVLRAGTANVVAALTAEGWVLVDTGTRAEAIPIRQEVQRLATRPIVAVFNTHFHDDHSGGNAVYRGMGVPVYASRATVELEKNLLERMKTGVPREAARLDSAAAGAMAGPEGDRVASFYDFLARWWREGLDDATRDPLFVVPADRPFDGRLELSIGGVRVEARAFSRGAHSAGDAIVAFPGRGVVAVGDIVVKGGAPWADQFVGGGSLEGVLAAQDSLLLWLGAVAAPDTGGWRIVPGHGAVVREAELAADHKALLQLRACARQAFEAGRPRGLAADDCAGTGFPGAAGAYAVWQFDAEWRTGKAGGTTTKTKPAKAPKSKSARSGA
jgi:cyclase